MAAVGETLRVEGFEDLSRAFAVADKTPKKDSATPTKDDKSGTFTFKVPVDVVVVNAIVTDKQGNPVKDLKVDDFRVYEDGKLQPIHTFALESYKATQDSAQTPGKPTGATATEDPGSTQSRMISIVVDDLATFALGPSVDTADVGA